MYIIYGMQAQQFCKPILYLNLMPCQLKCVEYGLDRPQARPLLPARESRMAPYVKGECHEGYQSVKQLFEQHFVDEVNEYAQLCVYVQGVKVVDLYGARPKGGTKSRLQYSETSLQNVFSSTKVLTSLVIAMLVDWQAWIWTKSCRNLARIWPVR